MKNLIVYVGTIKKAKNYKKDAESTYIPDCEFSSISLGFSKPNVETINEQATLIENQFCHFYNYELINSFIDKLKIILDVGCSIINSVPSYNGELLYVKDSLVPYYE